MNKKFLVLVMVVALVAVGLMYQAAQSGTSRVFMPSDLSRKEGTVVLPRIRVVGRVSADVEIKYDLEPRAELRFAIVNPPDAATAASMAGGFGAGDNNRTEGEARSPQTEHVHAPVPVVYRGLRPDMFAPGRDVIIDGEFREGTVIASSLLTQCPSKYEAPSPEEKFNVGAPAGASSAQSGSGY